MNDYIENSNRIEKLMLSYEQATPIIVVGFPIISRLIRGYTVKLDNLVLIPDGQLFNESKNTFARVEEGIGTTKITLVSVNE